MANETITNQNYDYATAGYNEFMSRAVDSNVGVNLDQQAKSFMQLNRSMNFDGAVASGGLGSTVTVGGITIDGVGGKISFNNKANQTSFSLGGTSALDINDPNGNDTIKDGTLVGSRLLGLSTPTATTQLIPLSGGYDAAKPYFGLSLSDYSTIPSLVTNITVPEGAKTLEISVTIPSLTVDVTGPYMLIVDGQNVVYSIDLTVTVAITGFSMVPNTLVYYQDVSQVAGGTPKNYSVLVGGRSAGTATMASPAFIAVSIA